MRKSRLLRLPSLLPFAVLLSVLLVAPSTATASAEAPAPSGAGVMQDKPETASGGGQAIDDDARRVWNCIVRVDPPYFIQPSDTKFIQGPGGQDCFGTYAVHYACVGIERFNSSTGRWTPLGSRLGLGLRTCSSNTTGSEARVVHSANCGTRGSTYSFRAVAQGFVLGQGAANWSSSQNYYSPTRYTTC